MPTYEYLCQNCNHRFEIWQKMSDEPLTICSECGGHIRRVLYPAGIVFKGSGFYKTDHRNAPNGSANGANGHTQETKGEGESKAAEPQTTSSSSTESKPAEGGSNKSGTGEKKASAATGGRGQASPAHT